MTILYGRRGNMIFLGTEQERKFLQELEEMYWFYNEYMRPLYEPGPRLFEANATPLGGFVDSPPPE